MVYYIEFKAGALLSPLLFYYGYARMKYDKQ